MSPSCAVKSGWFFNAPVFSPAPLLKMSSFAFAISACRKSSGAKSLKIHFAQPPYGKKSQHALTKAPLPSRSVEPTALLGDTPNSLSQVSVIGPYAAITYRRPIYV